MPLATTVSVARSPPLIVGPTGCVVMAGRAQLATVTLTALLFTGFAPHPLLTRTQYVAFAVGRTVIDAALLFAIGDVVTPVAPWYHWY